MSQIEKNKAVVKRYFEAYNNKDEAVFDEIISPDYIDHGIKLLTKKSSLRTIRIWVKFSL